jgi:hypothetical protein
MTLYGVVVKLSGVLMNEHRERVCSNHEGDDYFAADP